MAQDYALFETPEADLIIFCPIHAERRIIFEKLKKQLIQREKSIQQPLLFPFSIELEPLSVVALENNRDSLRSNRIFSRALWTANTELENDSRKRGSFPPDLLHGHSKKEENSPFD